MTIEEMIVSAKSGDTVVLPDETIRITEPIELNGKKNISIVGSKNTVLTGSIILDGEWTDHDGNMRILKTEKGLDIQQIYVNGKKYIMARYPNEDPTKWLDGHCEDALSAERIASWKDPKGGYIRALHCAEWGGNSYIINGKNEDGTLDLKWIGDNNRGSDYHKNVVMVENIFEELDSEREWFYDKENGLLYIIPEKGTDLSSAVVEAAVNGEIFKFTDCENVSVRNITFKNTKRLLFCSEYELITRSDWGIARNGAIYINNCENVKISDCNFNEVGGNCVFIDGKNEYISVENCDLTDCGASGICIFGDQKCVRDLSTWSDHRTVISDLERGPKSDEYPRNIKVKDCYFYNLGIYEKQTSPVTMSVSSKVTVEGCTIHHVPRAGLNVCDGSFGGHRFINNLVFDTVRETGDHGPFNSWGRDRFWSLDGYDTGGNNGANKRKVATLDAIETTVIAHNMFVGNRGFGIDLDDGSTNYMITKNYCVGVGIKLREGFLRTVRNNFVVNAPLDVHCTFENCDDVIENNIIVTERPLSLYAINEGFTTRAANNLFVGADKEVLTNSFLKDNVNYVCDKNDRAALTMSPEQIYFEPIVMEFGRKDKPKPVIEILETAAVETVKALDATFMQIDESVRSMAGLPDYEGATVTEISEGSALYILGARKDDVIISVNGDKIKTPADMTKVTEIKGIKLIRAQKEIIL